MAAFDANTHHGFNDPKTDDARLFAAYFASTQQILILLAFDGTILAANRAALRAAGDATGTMVGHPFWFAPWWRNSPGTVERLRLAVQAAAQRGATIRFDVQSGPEFPAPLTFDLSLTPIQDDSGRVLRVMVEGRDVTEARDVENALRANEQRLRDMVEGSVQGIVVHRGDRILFANPAYAQILGYGSVLDVIGLPVDRVLPEPARETARRAWALLLSGARLPMIRNAQNLRRDGSIVHLNVLSRRIVWDGHHAIQSTVVDVTAQTLADAAEAARLAAEEASRTKSAFIATMSHELRTPLNAILGFAGMIQSGTRDPDHAEYAADITLAARHLLTVINDMLHLSKIEAGRLELDLCWIPLENELRQVQRIARGLAKDRVLEIELFLPPVTQALLLRADERALRQLLLNIVGNAVKFTPDGGSVAIAAMQEADGGLTIAISDTGVGIRAEDLERIWRPFEQVGRVSDHQNGTGLGLSIARALAELHGASVSVSSELDCGTTFRFTFPAAAVTMAAARQPAAGGGTAARA